MRIREERTTERFSQEELAKEISITRMALANYEQGVSKLPFEIGMAICRRLDLSPRWLATGVGEKRPFVTPEQLGLNADQMKLPKRKVDFFLGFKQIVEEPLKLWEGSQSKDEWLKQMLAGGPEKLAMRLSIAELEQTVITSLCSAVASGHSDMKAAYLENVVIFARELKTRLDPKTKLTYTVES